MSGRVLDVDYRDKRWNEERDEWEYYIDSCNDWLNEEEIKEWLAESDYWSDWADEVMGQHGDEW